MSENASTVIMDQEINVQDYQISGTYLNTDLGDIHYCFEIKSISEILSRIDISKENRIEGWVIFRHYDRSFILFDLRNDYSEKNDASVTIVLAKVLSHGTVAPVGFIFENVTKFLKKLYDKP